MAKQNPLILNMIVVINMTISVLSLSTQAGDCESLGGLTCHGKRYQTFECSPPITSPTQAKLTNNNFAKGGDGGDPSECDNQYHPNSEPVVALSTGWYSGSSMCGNKILITASTGRSIVATVVDECDSRRGCDKEHAGLPPCRNDVVDGSDAVWEHLGLNTDEGVVDITWSMF